MVTWSGLSLDGKAKNKLKIPNAHPHLDAVGVGLAIIGRLGKIDLRLLRSLDS